MFVELIAAFAAGVLAAGSVMILRHLFGNIIPKWMIPAAAGVAMIGFGTYMETGWYERTTGGFPDSVEVISTSQTASAFRPWTYLWPTTNGMSAVDTKSIRFNENVPDQRLAQILFLGRWRSSEVLPVVLDCAGGRMAPMRDTVTFDDRGAAVEADWANVGLDDPALSLICEEEMQ